MSETLENTIVPVEIKNWADIYVKPKIVTRTTFKTYIIDAAEVVGVKNIQISDYEPKRMRTVIHIVEGSVALTLEPPVTSPDATGVGIAPQGRYLPGSIDKEYVFYGPDAMWLNSLVAVAASRVTVTKEYC